MAKPMGAGIIYLASGASSLCKIGMTTGKPKDRLSKAKADLGERNVRIIETWVHDRAFIVERFTHFYLQNLHREGECFEITECDAIKAVNRVIAFVKPAIGVGKDWLSRAGMSEQDATEFFSTMPGQDMPLSGAAAGERFWSRYWGNQYQTRHKRKIATWTTQPASDRFYEARVQGWDIQKYEHLWGHPGYTQDEVLRMMGVTRNTAKKYMKATWKQAAFKNRDNFQRQIKTAARRQAKEQKDG